MSEKEVKYLKLVNYCNYLAIQIIKEETRGHVVHRIIQSNLDDDQYVDIIGKKVKHLMTGVCEVWIKVKEKVRVSVHSHCEYARYKDISSDYRRNYHMFEKTYAGWQKLFLTNLFAMWVVRYLLRTENEGVYELFPDVLLRTNLIGTADSEKRHPVEIRFSDGNWYPLYVCPCNLTLPLGIWDLYQSKYKTKRIVNDPQLRIPEHYFGLFGGGFRPQVKVPFKFLLQMYKYRRAHGILKRSLLFRQKIRAWVESLWRPPKGRLVLAGYKECQKVLEMANPKAW